MPDFVTRFIQPIVQIKREEWRKVLLMFLYFTFTIATLYVVKPVRDSLFITSHGAKNLPLAYLGQPIATLLATFFYTLLAKRLTKKHVLFSVVCLFFASNLVLFWALFVSGHTKWLVYVYYLWSAAYSITVVTQFWTLANDIFNPQEAKRLFGLIISGGGVGGMLGALLTKTLAERVGTENLLFLPVGFLLVSVVLINVIWKTERPAHVTDRAEKKEGVKDAKLRDKSSWRELFSSKYLLMIVAIVFLAKLSSTFVDNQFKSVVEQSVLTKDAKTAFFGSFSFWLNAVSYVMQLIIASRFLRYFGLGISLLLLPVGLCLGSITVAFVPLLGIAAATKIYDGSLNYSIQKMGQEILYLPIPRKIRYKVKPIIDMFFYRLSPAVAALFILVATRYLNLPTQMLGLLLVGAVPIWLISVWIARGEYLKTIRKLLSDEKTVVRSAGDHKYEGDYTSGQFVHLTDDRSFEGLKEFLNHRSSVARKISATACLAFYAGARDVNRVNKLVQEMMRYEALELKGETLDRLFEERTSKQNGKLDAYLVKLLQASKDPKVDFSQLLRSEEKELLLKLSDCLGDHRQEVRDKRKAILILTTLGTQGAVDILLSSLAATQDHSLRYNVIRSLNRIRAKGEIREFNSWVIKKELLSEIRHNQSLIAGLAEYTARKNLKRPEEDYLFATLQALREESLERIFRLLSLLYSSDVIHMVYDRLVEMNTNKHVRAHALELLENVIEPELARKLRPIFDDGERTGTPKKELEETIQNFMASQDRWLQVCAVFLIAELGLYRFFGVLRDEVHSRTPIVREAAEIALVKINQKG